MLKVSHFGKGYLASNGSGEQKNKWIYRSDDIKGLWGWGFVYAIYTQCKCPLNALIFGTCINNIFI